MRPDWLLHLRHAWQHMVTAQNLIALGDRADALRHIKEARVDLGWAERQLTADLTEGERT